MAIKLQSLYEAINNQFDVILHTNSFYDKEVTWIHTVEQGEFSHLLHGDELIFNSGLNFYLSGLAERVLKVIERRTRQRTDHLCKNRVLHFPRRLSTIAMKYSFRCSPLPGTLRSLISCGSFLRFY